MQKTSTKLLVIVITTTAIIAAATITTSIGAARPAFAKVNCNEDGSICSGGKSNKQADFDTPGGFGSRTVAEPEQTTISGGLGKNDGTVVDGQGGLTVCDDTRCTPLVGSSGLHPK